MNSFILVNHYIPGTSNIFGWVIKKGRDSWGSLAKDKVQNLDMKKTPNSVLKNEIWHFGI